MPPAGPPAIPLLDTFGQVAILLATTVFELDHDHPLRDSWCVHCRQPVGGLSVTVIGAVGLEYKPCQTGCVPADAYLIHAHHLPLSDEAFAAAIRYGMECPTNH